MNKDDIAKYDERFPEKDYKKSSFAFSTQELRELQEFSPIQKMGLIAQTLVEQKQLKEFVPIQQLGQIANTMMSQLINNIFLKRLGIPASPDVGVLYDIPSGQAIVYVPKIWCNMCRIKKAQYRFENMFYCQGCTEELRKQLQSNPKTLKKTKEVVKQTKSDKEQSKEQGKLENKA